MPPLTPEQQKAVNALVEALSRKSYNRGYRGSDYILLHGVTGSGKTRVYLEVVRKALDLGLKTLILVPEINLTPQTRKRFEDFLGCKIPILHSALSAREKRETWKELLNSQLSTTILSTPQTESSDVHQLNSERYGSLNSQLILMGTRSAILAPFEPQLIIIDEEHDSSYKQQDPAPRYNVREMAFHIAHKYGALVILGSATPSLETYWHAKNGNLKLIEMKSRPGNLPLPKVVIADMKEERKKQDKDLMLSPILRDALSQTISKGNQAIILLNRRGYSTSKICEECGDSQLCSDCNVALVYHKQHNGLICHYCGKVFPLDFQCKCGSKKFTFYGSGIEKAEEEIKEWLPDAKILRLDADTTSRLGATEKLLQKFRNKECNILLGTQMVAKGHDFPDVSLVGVLCADIGSSIPDFRASERYFQLLTQVAGRAGRSPVGAGSACPGCSSPAGAHVIIQTFCPENPVMQFAIKHDYLGFAKAELAERKEAFYPPFCKIAQIKLQAKNKETLEKAANELAGLLRGKTGQQGASLTVLGPAEPFVSKVQKYHRMTITIKSENSGLIKNAIKNALANKITKGVEIRIDRDC